MYVSIVSNVQMVTTVMMRYNRLKFYLKYFLIGLSFYEILAKITSCLGLLIHYSSNMFEVTMLIFYDHILVLSLPICFSLPEL